MDAGGGKRKFRDGPERRGPGSYRAYLAGKIRTSRDDGPQRLFAHKSAPTTDAMLVALERYGNLSPRQIAEMCDITSTTARRALRGLRARGLICMATADDRRTARVAVSLDARHPGSESLALYLRCIGGTFSLPRPRGRTPMPASAPSPFPVRPARLFHETSRTNAVLALSLVSEMRLSDLHTICAATNHALTFHGVVMLWRMRRVIAARPGRRQQEPANRFP